MGMIEAQDGACLRDELLYLFVGQLCMQDFDGRQGIEREMFSQVNIGEGSLCYQLDEAIVAKLLPHAISTSCHLIPLSLKVRCRGDSY
jgi:hypothetical protein